MIIIESAYVTNRLQNGFRKNTWYSFLRGPKQHHYLSFFRNFLKNRMERSQDLFYQGLIYRSLMIGLSFWYIVIKIKGALNNFNFMHRLIRASSTLPFRATYGHLTVVRARGEVNWQKGSPGGGNFEPCLGGVGNWCQRFQVFSVEYACFSFRNGGFRV